MDDTRHPAEWFGNKTIIDGHEVECDQEMVDGIVVYLDAIRADILPGDVTWTEMPLLEALQKVDKDFGGTADHVRYRPSTFHLKVTDLKFGSGTYVDVSDNKQLKKYALGAMIASDKLIQTVEVCIVQPRHEGSEPIRSETFAAVDILDFVADLKEAAAATRLPNAPLKSGTWCKFCPNARTCPELERHQHALVAQQFAVGAPYDPDALAKALTSIPLVKERIKAIEEFAYAEATRGSEIPGFKLVAKRANRKWADEDELRQWGIRENVNVFDAPELLSVAQLEKRVKEAAPKGKKKDAGDALKPFVVKQSSGNTLVPESDNRPPAKTVSAEDFNLLE